MARLDRWGDKISPYDDLIDTREVLDRIEEIESDHLDTDSGEMIGMGGWSIADRAEWTGLTDMIRDVGDAASRDGVTMIRETHFRDHIRDEYLEIGGEYYEWNPDTHRHDLIPPAELYSRLPFSCIDWDAVAEECRSDYSVYEFDGVTYYYMGQ